MDAFTVSRVAVPAYFLSFFLLAGLLPAWRLRRRSGNTGYVAHLAPSPVHRLAVDALRGFVMGVVTWIVLYAALGPERLGVWLLPVWMGWAGWFAMLVALVGVMLAQVQMGISWRVGIDKKRTPLVVEGLFQFIRNPIFSAMLLACLGLVAVTPSAWTVMGWLFLAFVLALQVRLEEAHLLAMHGESYRTYASRTGRFVPFLGRLPSQSSEAAL